MPDPVSGQRRQQGDTDQAELEGELQVFTVGAPDRLAVLHRVNQLEHVMKTAGTNALQPDGARHVQHRLPDPEPPLGFVELEQPFDHG